MSIRRIIQSLAVIVLFFLSIVTIHAQTPTIIPLVTQPEQSPSPPMLGSMVQSQACPTVAWSCATTTDLDPGSHEGPHRIQLTQSGLPIHDAQGQPTKFYIACGTESPSGFLMTTNNREYDEMLCLGKDTSIKLHDDFIYNLEFVNTPNPMTSTDGSITAVVKPSNLGLPKTHMCMIGWVIPPSKIESTKTDPSKIDDDSASSIVYSTFSIGTQETRTSSAPPGVCTTVYTDPFGRVYNKQLRPVPGASVSISEYDLRTLIRLPGTRNPVTTDESGTFNFNIPPGRSYLQTSLTNEPLDVHPNFARAYTEPYTYGDLIIETAGNPQQRDIPVSGGGTPVLKLTGYSHLRFGDSDYIQGNATWPLTLVDVMQGTTSIAHEQSDKFGNFAFKLDPAKVDPAQQLTLKLTEVDLTIDPTMPAPAPATVSTSFDPIPSYIEGRAYDIHGVLIPFARVRVRLTLSDSLYYETSADAQGNYSIAPAHIPMFPYYLEIAPGTGPAKSGALGRGDSPVAGAVSKITVPLYAKQNKEYLAVNGVNIMTGTKNGSSVAPFQPQNESTSGKPARINSVTPKTLQAQNYVTVLILLAVLLLGGAGAAYMYVRREKGVSGEGEIYKKEGV